MVYKYISVRNFHIYDPIFVKFGMRDPHTVLWSACEFREKRYREGRTLVRLNIMIFLVDRTAW